MKFNKIISTVIGAWAIVGTAGAAQIDERVLRPVYGTNNVNAYIYNNQNTTNDGLNWYVGARFDYNLATFDNNYSLESNTNTTSDSFAFKPQMGFDITAGYRFDSKWRMELNYGYTGKYENKESLIAFDIATHYLTLNGIYTIAEWDTTSLFLGAGLGAGFQTMNWNGETVFDAGAETSETSPLFTGNLQFGLEEKISDNVRLVLSYKLGYMMGYKQSILLQDGDTFFIENDVINNTFGLGLRFVF
jgi:opacity protein-like surface antigen